MRQISGYIDVVYIRWLNVGILVQNITVAQNGGCGDRVCVSKHGDERMSLQH